jgi:ketosteroid isomerase-like protein
VSDLNELLDREAVRDVVFRYAVRLDDRDAEGVAACFTDDARLSFNDHALEYEGREAILSVYRVALGVGPGANGERTTHLTSNVLVECRGDQATGSTKVVAFLLAGDVVRLRGLHFSDAFRRTPEGWRFSERAHRVDWQAEIPATAVTVPRFSDAL